jgi:hypothetical protein
MTRGILSLAILGCLVIGSASAQYQNPYNPYGQGNYGQGGYGQGMPFQPYSPYSQQGMAPNMYNRSTQPLSPYLNLLRNGSNPAVDYYFGVRPGTPSGQPLGQGQGQQQFGGMNNMYSQMRVGYLPQAGALSFDPQPLPDAGKEIVLPPSGHGVYYGNTFGISRTGIPGANMSRGGFFQAPMTGTVRPQQGTTPRPR